MAIDRKVSDQDNVPGLYLTPPQNGDYFLIAREDVNNYKLGYGRLYNIIRDGVVFTTGDQTIDGEKTFRDQLFAPGGISGNVTGNVNGVPTRQRDF